MGKYSRQFFGKRKHLSRHSAEQIVPWICRALAPRSVLDVGCGTGTWLSEFAKHGVTEGLGLDGPWVDTDMLEIPADRFRRENLEAPFRLGKKFDLVVSLEVAEHLSPAAAKGFVETLTAHSDVVLFSAAVPEQDGYHHQNEQWPDYWIDLFAAQGFRMLDVLRPVFWDDEKVAFWYKQNGMIFVSEAMTLGFQMAELAQGPSFGGKAVVHPEMFLEKQWKSRHQGIIQVLKQVPRALIRSFRYNLGMDQK